MYECIGSASSYRKILRFDCIELDLKISLILLLLSLRLRQLDSENKNRLLLLVIVVTMTPILFHKIQSHSFSVPLLGEKFQHK